MQSHKLNLAGWRMPMDGQRNSKQEEDDEDEVGKGAADWELGNWLKLCHSSKKMTKRCDERCDDDPKDKASGTGKRCE